MESVRKHSKKRDAILDCIRTTKIHPSAEWVYQQLKPQIPDLSLGTVYRNLAMFKADGTICSLGTVAGLERYDGDTSPHTHLICTTCAGVLDLEPIELPPSLLENACRQTGASISSHQLQFFGTCKGCREKQA